MLDSLWRIDTGRLYFQSDISNDDPLIPQKKIGVELSSFCDDSTNAHIKEGPFPLLKYAPRSRTITYRTFTYSKEDLDHCYLVGGTYKYQKGEFVEVESYDMRPKPTEN